MIKFAVSLASLLAIAACGTSPTTSQATAAVQLTASPATITAAACPPAHCGTLTGQFEVLATVTVRESAGVGGTITRVSQNLRRQSDNASIASTTDTPNTRIAANGTATAAIAMHYDQTLGERNMKVVVTVDMVDDNGHTVTTTMEIQVIS